MLKSLRWRLQLWHALILGIVLVVFGAVFYRVLQRSTFSDIDNDLLRSARDLERSMRGMPEAGFEAAVADWPLQLPQPPIARFGPPRPPPPDGPRSGPPEGPQDRFGDPRRRDPREPPRRESSYFVIFTSDGQRLRAEPPGQATEWSPLQRGVEFRNVEGRREVVIPGPRGTGIIVGRDIQHVFDRLHQSLIMLIGMGLAVLAFGVLGGWWLSGRAIRPIADISHTAASISSDNLSARIAAESMDAELRSLANTLNSMLGRLEGSFQKQLQFTADASHELRTPIAVLLSHCELALRRERSTDEYQQTLATCQTAGQRMQGLVEGLLTLARADGGGLDLASEQVDLRGLAEQTVALLRPLAAQHRLTLKCSGTEAICKADSPQISQVLSNLVHNAILYNRPGGSVTIVSSQTDNEAVLTVEDTGVGIPESSLPRLFDRFYRVDEARSRSTGGSGLGLAICKSIVDAHGGSLKVTSNLGTGSRFDMRLPKR